MVCGLIINPGPVKTLPSYHMNQFYLMKLYSNGSLLQLTIRFLRRNKCIQNAPLKQGKKTRQDKNTGDKKTGPV